MQYSMPSGAPEGQKTTAKGQKAKGRSRVTNGNALLSGIVDARSKIYRRFRDIAAAIASDQGGAGQLSEARTQLVRRFAAAACLAEAMETRLVNGETIDLQQHALLCSTLVRIVRRIGIDRLPKNVTPALRDYLEAAAEPEPEEDDETS